MIPVAGLLFTPHRYSHPVDVRVGDPNGDYWKLRICAIAENNYLEALWKEQRRVGQMLNYHNKQSVIYRDVMLLLLFSYSIQKLECHTILRYMHNRCYRLPDPRVHNVKCTVFNTV